MVVAFGRISHMPRVGNYRFLSHQVRFTHNPAMKTSALNNTSKATTEARAQRVALGELRTANKKAVYPKPIENKYSHYDKSPDSTEPQRYDKLKLIGAAPDELDEDTCRQSWELEQELKKRIIKGE